jgi:hypothetical protein
MKKQYAIQSGGVSYTAVLEKQGDCRFLIYGLFDSGKALRKIRLALLLGSSPKFCVECIGGPTFYGRSVAAVLNEMSSWVIKQRGVILAGTGKMH